MPLLRPALAVGCIAVTALALAAPTTAAPTSAAPLTVDPNAYVASSIPTVPQPKGVGATGFSGVIAGSGNDTASVFSTCLPKICTPGSGTTVPTGRVPTDVAVAPETDDRQARAYITNAGDGTMTLIPLSQGLPAGAPVSLVTGGVPTGIALSPDGRWAYVSDNLANALVLYDTVNLRRDGLITVGTGPWGVAVSPDGTRIYVAANKANIVSVIDTATRTVIAAIPVGSNPGDIALDPSGRTLYVPNNASGTVSVIDTATNTVRATVPVGAQPWGVAATDTHAFVANFASSSVSVIDRATTSVVATVAVGTSPFGVAIDADRQVLVTNSGSSTLSVIALRAYRPSVTWQVSRPTRTISGTVPLTPAVTYGIVSRKGSTTRTGTCELAAANGPVTCRVQVGRGTWRTSITTKLPWQPTPGGQQNRRYTFR